MQEAWLCSMQPVHGLPVRAMCPLAAWFQPAVGCCVMAKPMTLCDMLSMHSVDAGLYFAGLAAVAPPIKRSAAFGARQVLATPPIFCSTTGVEKHYDV